MKPIVRTIWFYFFSSLTVLFLLLPIGLIALMRPSVATTTWFNTILFWAYCIIVWAARLPIQREDSENMPKKPIIIVANHQSALDIPFIGWLMGIRTHQWLFKQELTKLPLLGAMLHAVGVSVDRRSARQAVASINAIVERVEKSPSTIIIFPEGGRYVDEDIHQFLAGFARIARTIQYPVVPVYMKGFAQVYKPASFWVYKNPVSMKVGPAFYIQPEETDQQFIDRVRTWFLEQ